MRMILFFDLPTETAGDKQAYSAFRKLLIRNGFIMMQKSVYCKLAINQNILESILATIRKNKPPKGVIQVLTVTEKQYSRIEFILGTHTGDILDTDERYVEL